MALYDDIMLEILAVALKGLSVLPKVLDTSCCKLKIVNCGKINWVIIFLIPEHLFSKLFEISTPTHFVSCHYQSKTAYIKTNSFQAAKGLNWLMVSCFIVRSTKLHNLMLPMLAIKCDSAWFSYYSFANATKIMTYNPLTIAASLFANIWWRLILGSFKVLIFDNKNCS